GAADQLDDDVAGGQDLVEIPLLRAEDAGHLRPPAGDLLHHVGPLFEQLLERRAHGPLAEDPDVHGLRHHSSRTSRSSQVSRRTTTLASPSRQKTTGGRRSPLAFFAIPYPSTPGPGGPRTSPPLGSASSVSRISTSPDSQCFPAIVASVSGASPARFAITAS